MVTSYYVVMFIIIVYNNKEREILQEITIYETQQEYQLYGKYWPDETV